MVTATAIYYRPLYSILMLLLLFIEYYNAALLIYKIKTNDSYTRLKVLKPDVSDMLLINIWFTLCEVNAFKRVYFIFTKNKKVSARSLVLFFIIYLFYIPLRLLKLAHYFITSKEDFRTSLIFLTLDSYDNVANLQIEVLHKDIYLNCNNFIKLSSLLINNNKLLSKKMFCKGMVSLREASREFSKKEAKYGRREVDLAIVYDAEGRQISNVPHYTVVEGSTSLHATSNIKRVFDANQRVDGIIPTLTKQGAVAPGTVVTKGVSGVKKISHRSVWVPNSEIDAVRANHMEFAVSDNIRNYQNEKHETFKEILQKEFFFCKNPDPNLLQKFRYNEFTRDLNMAEMADFERTYDEVFRSIARDSGAE